MSALTPESVQAGDLLEGSKRAGGGVGNGVHALNRAVTHQHRLDRANSRSTISSWPAPSALF